MKKRKTGLAHAGPVFFLNNKTLTKEQLEASTDGLDENW
jgi:hypothetical protein